MKHKNHRLKNIIMLLFSQLLGAFVYNLFILPADLVTGGSNGIATIINNIYGIDPALMILIVSIICFIFSMMYLDRETTIGSLIAIIIYPIFVKLTSPIAAMVQMDYTDMFIIAIYGGVFGGISSGLMYKSGYNGGGLPVISQILEKKKKIPIAKTSGIMNTMIVLMGAVFFGWTKTMYALILIYINSLVINKILLGISSNKAFYIITNEKDAIKDYIIRALGHSATIFDVKGGFLQKKNDVVLTVIPTNEYYKVTEGIRMIDKDAFFVVTDAYEVSGGK